MTKPNKGGWIRHRGGKCPVEAGNLVDVRYRDGSTGVGLKAMRDYNFDTEHHSGWDADEEYWSHESLPGDIMAWRPHKPSVFDEPSEPNDALKEVLELDAHESEWKAHDGRKCSAPDRSVVEVLLRNGAVLPAHDCERFTWEHSAVEADRQIMAYRVVDMRDPVSYDDDHCASDCDGPIQWRDRIREIDAASKEEEARHCAAMAAYDEERASLVAKLKAEGFVLIQSDEPNGEVESAQQDMSDPANWKVGDVVEIESSTNDGWLSRKGMLGNLEWDGEWRIEFNGENVWYVSDNTKVKWHSRPKN